MPSLEALKIDQAVELETQISEIVDLFQDIREKFEKNFKKGVKNYEHSQEKANKPENQKIRDLYETYCHVFPEAMKKLEMEKPDSAWLKDERAKLTLSILNLINNLNVKWRPAKPKIVNSSDHQPAKQATFSLWEEFD